MLNWFNCYLSGRHEFGVWCEPGAIFLRCLHCGRRSPGWSLGPQTRTVPPLPSHTTSSPTSVVKAAVAAVTVPPAGRVLPFSRMTSG